MSLGNWLRKGRECYPTKTALIFGDRSWTYAELDHITDQLATSLIQQGMQPGDRVALHLTNSPEIIFCYYACFKIGAIAVPLNFRLKGPELEYVLNHCGARILIGQSELFSEVQQVREALTIERYYVVEDTGRFSDVNSFTELLEQSTVKIPLPTVAGDAVATILYTSGTTARPKGVMHTHSTLEQTAACYIESAGLNDRDILGGMLPLSHIFGFALQLLTSVSIGATLVVMPRFEPELVLQSLEQHRVTKLCGLPVMYNILVGYSNVATYDLSALKVCFAGGDAVPGTLHRRFQTTFGVELTEGCGMTEVIPYSLNPPYGEKRVGSIGKATVGMSLRLVDDRDQDVAPGEMGEILVKSEATMIGYWQNPEATAATLKDGWLRTGDLARVDEDGYYWFLSRKKEIIIRGGSNISPIEVEAVLYQHPAIREAAVVGVPDQTWGEIVQAYVALRTGQLATEVELQEFMGLRIAAYKVPTAIAFLPELPKGLTGKIHRKTLQDWAIATVRASVSPAGVEQAVAAYNDG